MLCKMGVLCQMGVLCKMGVLVSETDECVDGCAGE